MIGFLNPTLLSLSGILLGLVTLASLLWWLKLARRVIYPFPLLTHLAASTSSKLHLRWLPPPPLPFGIFVLMALCGFFLSLKPIWRIIPEKENTTHQKHLWILDMSPSVSAAISATDYEDLVKQEAAQLSAKATISWITTSQMKPQPPMAASDFRHLNLNLRFHKPGLRAGSLLSHLRHQMKDYHAVKIFTDAAPSSWPSPLLRQIKRTSAQATTVEIKHLALPGTGANLYFKNVARPSAANNDHLKLDVTIGQSSHLSQPPAGTLKLYSLSGQSAKELIADRDFQFPEQTRELAIPISGFVRNTMDIYELILETEDLMNLDNTYYGLASQTKKVLMVGSAFGESTLHDPLHPHMASAKVMGYPLSRWDHFPQNPSLSQVEVVMIFLPAGDTEDFLTSYCPALPEQTEVSKVILLPAVGSGFAKAACPCLTSITQNFPKDISCSKESLRAFGESLLASGFRPHPVADNLMQPEFIYQHQLLTSEQNSSSTPVIEVVVSSVPLDPYKASHSPDSVVTHASLPFAVDRLLRLERDSRSSLPPASSELSPRQIVFAALNHGGNTEAIQYQKRLTTDITKAMHQLRIPWWPTLYESMDLSAAKIPENVPPFESQIYQGTRAQHSQISHSSGRLLGGGSSAETSEKTTEQASHNPFPKLVFMVVCVLMLMELIWLISSDRADGYLQGSKP